MSSALWMETGFECLYLKFGYRGRMWERGGCQMIIVTYSEIIINMTKKPARFSLNYIMVKCTNSTNVFPCAA